MLLEIHTNAAEKNVTYKYKRGKIAASSNRCRGYDRCAPLPQQIPDPRTLVVIENCLAEIQRLSREHQQPCACSRPEAPSSHRNSKQLNAVVPQCPLTVAPGIKVHGEIRLLLLSEKTFPVILQGNANITASSNKCRPLHPSASTNTRP